MTKTLPELARAATPGPWLAAASPSSVVGWPIVSPAAQGRVICSVNYVQHSKIDPPVSGDKSFNSESKANAAFIAAANPRRIIELCEALKECADDLEGMIKAHYEGSLDYPTEKRRYDRDMEPVIRARATLSPQPEKQPDRVGPEQAE